MTKQELQHEALLRARNNQSWANYPAILEGFAARGITDVRPRENVFTYNAWKALGRQVRKGEHGVKVVTFIDMEVGNGEEERKTIRRPRSTTVFHESQTEAIGS